MKAISIRQPWAGANRSHMFAHRGQTLVHAGLQLAGDFTDAERTILDVAGQEVPLLGRPGQSPAWQMGAIVAVVEVRAAHRGCDGSCSPWAQPGQVHHMLTHVGVLRRPVPCPGRLGIWTPEPLVVEEVKEVWPG